MLVLKNGNKVISEAGKPLVNNEVNALRIENTDRITIGFITTGPIAISWGDGTVLNLSTQALRYNASKLYASVGNWSIVVTNPENVKYIYFDSTIDYGYSVTKINSQINYLLQFINLYSLTIRSASFSGDIGRILVQLQKLERIWIYQQLSYNPFTINLTDAKTFWSRCKYMYVYSSINNFTIGKYDDIILPLDCEYVYLQNWSNASTGDLSGFIKSGYTKCTRMGYYVVSATLKDYPNTDDIVIPETLVEFGPQRGLVTSIPGRTGHGNLVNFNFKNIVNWSAEGGYDSFDLSSNQSFVTFAANCYTFNNTYMDGSIKVPLELFNNNTRITVLTLSRTQYPLNLGINKSYGDISGFVNRLSSFYLDSGSNDGSITGTISETTLLRNTIMGGIELSANATAIKRVLSRGVFAVWGNLSNFIGDISGTDCSSINNTAYGIQMESMPNLYLDITTLVWGTNWTNVYMPIILRKSPNFTGNLANLTLWANKSTIDLSSCAYTNIPGFVRKVFANRNTCLKAAGGNTSIYINNNVDNNLLTGIEQQPPLGTYTGNINDLTEAQIDNLAAGKDYTGTGTSTPWTDKECIWVMTKLKNSSTDSSLRYRCTFSY